MGNAQLKDIITHGDIMTKQDLISTHRSFYLNECEFLQLKHFISTIPHPIREESELTPIEKLCNAKKPIRHGTSQIYKILSELEGQGTLKMRTGHGHKARRKTNDRRSAQLCIGHNLDRGKLQMYGTLASDTR